jgi:chorismate lyase/3-hydroxybenzoate synthase
VGGTGTSRGVPIDLAATMGVHSGRQAELGSVVPGWKATGDARQDLPSWVRHCADLGARVASQATRTVGLSGEELQDAAFRVFDGCLGQLGVPPTRVWAFLPDITDVDDAGLTRYMHMNIGRSRAYVRHMSPGVPPPAGTGVGHEGDGLVVHALWMPGPTTAVENPRQVPAWRYSDRYGPVSPPFSRAVLTTRLLIASGTASVVGEETRHPRNLALQFDESIRNLEVLKTAAGVRGEWNGLQIYVRDEQDLEEVGSRSLDALGSVERIVQAPLCRSGLLVEIEGVVDV